MFPFFPRPVFSVTMVDSQTGRPLKDPDNLATATKQGVAWSEIKRDKNGRLTLINHKRKLGEWDGSRLGNEASPHNGSQANAQANLIQDQTPLGPNLVGPSNPNSCKSRRTAQRSGANAPELPPLSPEEDARLIQLKNAGSTWKQISADMQKPVSMLKGRWKVIKPADWTDGAVNAAAGTTAQSKKASGAGKIDKGKIDEGKHEEAKTKKSKRERKQDAVNAAAAAAATTPATCNSHKAEKNKQASAPAHTKCDMHKPHDEPKSRTRKPSKPSTPDAACTAHNRPSHTSSATLVEPRYTLQEWSTLQADGMFTLAELKLLMELAIRDRGQSWQRVASRFFDKTGKMVHPDDLRDKFRDLNHE